MCLQILEYEINLLQLFSESVVFVSLRSVRFSYLSANYDLNKTSLYPLGTADNLQLRLLIAFRRWPKAAPLTWMQISFNNERALSIRTSKNESPRRPTYSSLPGFNSALVQKTVGPIYIPPSARKTTSWVRKKTA